MRCGVFFVLECYNSFTKSPALCSASLFGAEVRASVAAAAIRCEADGTLLPARRGAGKEGIWGSPCELLLAAEMKWGNVFSTVAGT